MYAMGTSDPYSGVHSQRILVISALTSPALVQGVVLEDLNPVDVSGCVECTRRVDLRRCCHFVVASANAIATAMAAATCCDAAARPSMAMADTTL